jgi:hypothetical protein
MEFRFHNSDSHICWWMDGGTVGSANGLEENFSDWIVDREVQLRAALKIPRQGDGIQEIEAMMGAHTCGVLLQTATAIDVAVDQEMFAGTSGRTHTTDSRYVGEWMGRGLARRSRNRSRSGILPLHRSSSRTGRKRGWEASPTSNVAASVLQREFTQLCRNSWG